MNIVQIMEVVEGGMVARVWEVSPTTAARVAALMTGPPVSTFTPLSLDQLAASEVAASTMVLDGRGE